MSIIDWIYNRPLFTPATNTSLKLKENPMDFRTFSLTYYGKMKADKSPYVFPADVNLVMAQTGLERKTITDYLLVWDTVQAAYVKQWNRMPSVTEIIHEWEVDNGILPSATVPGPVTTPLPPRPEATTTATPWGRVFKPTAVVPTRIGELSIEDFTLLINHILDDRPQAPAADDGAAAMRAKLTAALEALK